MRRRCLRISPHGRAKEAEAISVASAQNPTATHVAGFHTWHKLGRFVKKSEKGVLILAPIVRRIRVNAVSPGFIDTPGLNELLGSSETGRQRLKMISNAVPVGRLGKPEEVAKAVVFLASDESSFVTGTELFVDGGFAQV